MPAAIEHCVLFCFVIKCIGFDNNKTDKCDLQQFPEFSSCHRKCDSVFNTSDSANVFSLFQMAQDLRPEERVEIVCYICAKVFFVCFCLLHLC